MGNMITDDSIKLMGKEDPPMPTAPIGAGKANRDAKTRAAKKSCTTCRQSKVRSSPDIGDKRDCIAVAKYSSCTSDGKNCGCSLSIYMWLMSTFRSVATQPMCSPRRAQIVDGSTKNVEQIRTSNVLQFEGYSHRPGS
jgi:hypothetical protein